MSNLCLDNFCVIFLIIVFAPRISLKKTTPQVTLSVQERVDLLKFQIAEQIKRKHKRPVLITPINDIDDYQYVDVRNKPRTPINEFDERKKDGKFLLPEIVTKTTPTPPILPYLPPDADSKPIERMKKRNRVKKRNRHMIKPVDTFYRRSSYDTSLFYKPMPLLHCQDVFTPIIAGYRKNVSYYHTGFVKVRDQQVKRIAQLLEKNTTMYSNDELTQLLYQISNLRIRLFEWDITAVEGLITVILGGAQHSWKNLRIALKEIISSWNLDLSNTTAFLTQAKIYRPPCVTITGYEGSTKTSSGIRYSKLTTAKSTCVTKKGKLCEDDSYNDRY